MSTGKTKTKKKNLLQNSANVSCGFCNKEYKSEKALSSHYDKCNIAKRFIEMEEEPTIYYVWKKIAKLRGTEFEEKVRFSRSTHYKGIKTFIDYAKSQHWNFIKEYIEWSLNNNLKITTWPNYENYTIFLKQFIMAERPREAVTRSIQYICDKGSYGNYFKSEHLERVFLDIEVGNVSPWLIFLYPKNDSLFDRMEIQHIYRFQKLIKVKVWDLKISRLGKSTKYIKETLKDTEI